MSYRDHGFEKKEPPMTASELYHAHRWRLVFCVCLCILAVACIFAVLLPD